MANLTISGYPISIGYLEYKSEQLSKEPTSTILFIHGAESSKETWLPNFENLKDFNLYAIDVRGHGESSLGNPALFKLSNLVQDIHTFVSKMNLGKIVLVAHSMGARIATCYATQYPEKIKALIIEDMEMKPRDQEVLDEKDLDRNKAFVPDQPTMERALEVLNDYGYSLEQIQKMKEQGKIYSHGNKVHIGVNPYATHLAKNEVSASEEAVDAFRKLKGSSFPVHLFLAGMESSVTKEGLSEMQIENPQLIVTYFPTADHRIHKTAAKKFNEKLSSIIMQLKIS